MAHTGLQSPIERASSITPSDDNDLTDTTRGLYVGVSGDVKVDLVGGSTAVTFVGLGASVASD